MQSIKNNTVNITNFLNAIKFHLKIDLNVSRMPSNRLEVPDIPEGF